jgi:hypothetical protein
MMDDNNGRKRMKKFFSVQTSSIYCMVCWWVLVLTFALKTPTKEESLSSPFVAPSSDPNRRRRH